ncbi:MAG: hypothetical protein ACKVQK_19260 [Burkholderiales bacterium]
MTIKQTILNRVLRCVVLIALSLLGTQSFAQVPTERRFADRASWVQLDLPQAWFGPRYTLSTRSGPQAAAQQAGAAYWLSFEYLPVAADQKRESLLRMSVFPLATWQKLGVAAPPGDLVVLTDTRVYLGALATSNPYPTESEDAKQFDAMRFTPQALLDAFSILGDAERNSVRSVSIGKPAPRNRQLADGRLVCTGREPGWTLAIAKGANARYSASDDAKSDAARKSNVASKSAKSRDADRQGAGKDKSSKSKPTPQAQALQGRMAFTESEAVWRGRAGKAGDWVAVMREDSCEVAPGGRGSHSVLLSRPDGRASQGCCRLAN